MQKFFLFFVLISPVFFSACHSDESSQQTGTPTATEESHIFPVTAFLRAQLKKMDTLPITPLLIYTANGKIDSTWLKREDIRQKALPFLSPEIDSTQMHSLFAEKAFLDQTINAYTFSFDPVKKLPDSVDVVHWDVYMNAQTNAIERIYIVKENDSVGRNVTRQLTWVINKWFSTRTITQNQSGRPEVTEAKLIWNFDD
jgi:hypothetical protein